MSSAAVVKINKQRGLYKANGPRWFAYHVINRSAGKVCRLYERRARELELNRKLPGLNTPEHMRQVWTEWDWSQGGEEWNLGQDWRRSVVEDLMLANAGTNPVTIEIGPGGGRWSTALQAASSKLILVDLTELSMELCREKLAGADNVEYRITDGSRLPDVADGSVDFIWSFDVFVHISPADQQGYMAEFARVMRPGAKAIIHHAGLGGVNGNMRSAMTSGMFAELVHASGLKLVQQFERWGPDDCFELPVAGDVISIFER
jgi:ubiquinone/menaquinone biosynthesis C-methylase UbiE